MPRFFYVMHKNHIIFDIKLLIGTCTSHAHHFIFKNKFDGTRHTLNKIKGNFRLYSPGTKMTKQLTQVQRFYVAFIQFKPEWLKQLLLYSVYTLSS